MMLTRKEFLRGGLFALRDFLGGEGSDAVSSQGPKVAMPTDDCLCRSGCFACAESCAAGALTLRPGAGLVVDHERCAGCGSCREACPLEPKGIVVLFDAGQ